MHGRYVSDKRGDAVFVLDPSDGTPLQVLSPRGCGGLGGITSCANWIYCLDADKGHLISFATKQPAELGHQPQLRTRPAFAIRLEAEGRERAAARVAEADAKRDAEPTYGIVDPLEAFRLSSLKAGVATPVSIIASEPSRKG